MKTLYDRLGITPQASEKAIQQSFFRLAKKFDSNPDANQDHTDIHAQYLAVREAFRTLSDPETRRNYDRSLQTIQSLAQRARTARTVAHSLKR